MILTLHSAIRTLDELSSAAKIQIGSDGWITILSVYMHLDGNEAEWRKAIRVYPEADWLYSPHFAHCIASPP